MIDEVSRTWCFIDIPAQYWLLELHYRCKVLSCVHERRTESQCFPLCPVWYHCGGLKADWEVVFFFFFNALTSNEGSAAITDSNKHLQKPQEEVWTAKHCNVILRIHSSDNQRILSSLFQNKEKPVMAALCWRLLVTNPQTRWAMS